MKLFSKKPKGKHKNVLIQWHDEPNQKYKRTISINAVWNGEEDDQIFFYFANVKEYVEAKNKKNNYDFWIVKEI